MARTDRFTTTEADAGAFERAHHDHWDDERRPTSADLAGDAQLDAQLDRSPRPPDDVASQMVAASVLHVALLQAQIPGAPLVRVSVEGLKPPGMRVLGANNLVVEWLAENPAYDLLLTDTGDVFVRPAS